MRLHDKSPWAYFSIFKKHVPLALSASFFVLVLPFFNCSLIGSQAAWAAPDSGMAKWNRGDYDAAVEEWQAQARKGDVNALFNLGEAYFNGRGVQRDAVKSNDYFLRAAELGYSPAMQRLGLNLYSNTEKRKEALLWLHRAADLGQAKACYVVSVAYFNGDGFPKNVALGLAYMLRAQDRGFPLAKASLKIMMFTANQAQRESAYKLVEELARKSDSNPKI